MLDKVEIKIIKTNKKIKILEYVSTLILISLFIVSYLDNSFMLNSEKTEIGLFFAAMLFPLFYILIIFQFTIFINFKLNKKDKFFLNVIMLVLEIIYLILLIFVGPYLFFKFSKFSLILSAFVIILFLLSNIYTLILLIKKILYQSQIRKKGSE